MLQGLTMKRGAEMAPKAIEAKPLSFYTGCITLIALQEQNDTRIVLLAKL